MTFNILDTSFSGFFSLASGMLGMAYPLIVQCIQRIDEKYLSDNLTLRFRREPLFDMFNTLLIISLLMAVFYVFFLAFPVAQLLLIIIVGSQALMTVALIVAMVLLVKLILVYYTPSQLSARIIRHFTIRDLSDLLDVAIYAAKNEDERLFEKCHERIRKLILDIQKDAEGSSEEPIVEYPQEFWDAYRRIVKLSCDDSNPTYFYHNNSISAYLYNQFSKTLISEQTYFRQWIALNQIADSKNLSWFMQYWTNAVSYVKTFSYQKSDNYIKTFMRHHIIIGAMLVYKKKYEWLNEMMSYTYSKPEDYPLIPSTFFHIFSFAKELRIMLEERFAFLGSRYTFKGMTSSVNDDNIVYGNAIEYMALLIIRLWSVNDYNITYSYPMALPPVAPESIDDNELNINISNFLRRKVRLWYKDRLIGKVRLAFIPKMADVLALLDSYIHACEEQNLAIKQMKKPNTERLKLFRRQLIDQSRKPLRLPSNFEKRNHDQHETHLLSQKNRMEDELFTIGRNISYTNYPDVLIDSLHIQANGFYNLFFVNHQPSAEYRIQYKDIFQAIRCLNVKADEYVVLSLGVYLGNFEAIYGKVNGLEYGEEEYKYKGLKIIPINSQIEGIIILKKTALPYVKMVEYSGLGNKLPLIDEESMLYSNIDEMYTDPTKENILVVCKYMNIYYNEESFNYIRFNVTYNMSLGELDLANINPII